MKMLILISAALTIAVSPTLADEARIAALEQQVSILERQNLALKEAVEKLSGLPLAELLGGPSAEPASETATTGEPAPSEPTAAELAEMEALQRRIDLIESQMQAEAKAANDPFRDVPKLRRSAADLAKERADRDRSLAEMRARMIELTTGR